RRRSARPPRPATPAPGPRGRAAGRTCAGRAGAGEWRRPPRAGARARRAATPPRSARPSRARQGPAAPGCRCADPGSCPLLSEGWCESIAAGPRPAPPRGYDEAARAPARRRPPMELVLLAIGVGLGVGIVVGAPGAGGGILAVPVLVFLLGMPPHAATASSLVIVLITALASLPHHARQQNVEWRAGLVFAGVSVVGAVLGSRLSALVPPDVLLTLFGVMLAVVAAAMLRRGRRPRRTEDAEAAARGTAPLADGGAP